MAFCYLAPFKLFCIFFFLVPDTLPFQPNTPNVMRGISLFNDSRGSA
ncbi:hypothetical protein PROSTU_01079 [Providencia stuartii ATCC 25827]|uniref:Uncharacterized protein n=1 Tax=Providencia stuartii ATCC 25827 TaxID=471874 RepID=A0AA87CSJ9_PROST|nr:hypothetical protein PROSTU_01107 [Providencia stuartii ATCC 25827]EDU60917.1 hypothetical protein PROSTU_01079 [Providencia stuartii ATCC 25827]